jgi:hypothetical protein
VGLIVKYHGESSPYVALFVAFGKKERSNVSTDEARAIGKALKAFEAEIRREFRERG